MCLLLVAHRACPGYRLIVAANRDEYHGRPTVAAAPWQDHAQILAGRDLEGGGTWLGMHLDGRFATVTNVRSGHAVRRSPRSRGLIVSDFLLAASMRLATQRSSCTGRATTTASISWRGMARR